MSGAEATVFGDDMVKPGILAMVSAGGTNVAGATCVTAICWLVPVRITDVKLPRVSAPGAESSIQYLG